MLNLRAKQLKEGLQQLVTDKDFQARLLAHPLIRMVDDTVDPRHKLPPEQAEAIVSSTPTKVTYIAPNTFVEALIGLLTSESDFSIYKPLIEAIDALPNGAEKVRLREMLRDLRSFSGTDTRAIREEILKLPNEMHAQVLSYALEEVENAIGRLPVKSGQLMPLIEGIRKIDYPPFKQAVETVLTTAQSLDDARGKLEAWFDDGMGRISEIYKRKLQWISLAVGLLLAVVLNVDSLYIVRAFWQDPALRLAVTEAAQQALEYTPLDPAARAGEDGTETAAASADAVADAINNLLSLQLPLGWEIVPVTPEMIAAAQAAGLPNPYDSTRNLANLVPGGSPNWLGLWLQKLIGFGVTMIAAAQGAPFWFDLLKRLTTRPSPPANA
jgi:hypothetical protein